MGGKAARRAKGRGGTGAVRCMCAGGHPEDFGSQEMPTGQRRRGGFGERNFRKALWVVVFRIFRCGGKGNGSLCGPVGEQFGSSTGPGKGGGSTGVGREGQREGGKRLWAAGQDVSADWSVKVLVGGVSR